MITQKPEYVPFIIPDSPPVLANRTYSVAESAANGFSIGTPLAATDANSEDTLTYAILSGNEDGVFALSSSGQLSIADNTTLDFETTLMYVLVVQVGDGNGNFDTADITILVGDVFEAVAPVVPATTRFVVETDPNGTAVGVPIIATDVNIGETLSFSIQSGNTDNIFAIDSVSGQITVADNTLMDFGVTSQYLLTIAVFDGILTGTGIVTINVTDVYIPVDPIIAPTFTRSISEAAASGALVGAPVTGTDANIEDTLTYSITSGNTNGVFAIDPNSGQITVLSNIFLDFETTPQYVLGVFLSDNTGRADSTTVTIDVTDFYEPIQPVLANAVFAILEGTADATNFGAPMAATDANPEDTLTYSIISGNASGIFAIDTNSGQLSVVDNTNLNFETTPVHSLTVRVDDGTLFNTATATVNVTNAAPTLVSSILNVSEAASNGTSVGTVVATDPGGAVFTFSITNGNADNIFAINNSGLITIADNSLLNYATAVQHLLNVQVSDGSLIDAGIITVNVINVAPTISPSTFTVNEAVSSGTFVGQIVSTDTASYSITSGNIGTAFVINSTGEIHTSGAIDYETLSQYVLNVQVSDGVVFANANITINVTNVAPVINDATFSINENVTVGTSVGTLPPTEAGLTYSITGGNTGVAFIIDNNGQITTNNTSINYETLSSYSLTVQVSDGFLIDTAVVTINVTNLGPSISSNTFSIFETASNGLSVGTMIGSDPSGGPITFSITSGNESGVFAINNAGVITVVNSTSINYETTSSYSLGIRVSDGLLAADAVATINVTNVAPSLSNLTLSVVETDTTGAVLGTMNGSDPKGGTLTYTILSGNGTGVFSISNAGLVAVADGSLIDFDTSTQHILSVRVSDGSLTATATLTINVSNVGPTLDAAAFGVGEGAAIGYVLGTVVTSGDPKGGIIAFSITAGNTGDAFAIHSSTGAISVNNNSINYETLNSYSLTVRVQDSSGLGNNATITINVGNEAPTIDPATFSVAESAPNTTVVGSVVASDINGGSLTYSIISGNVDNIFVINNNGRIDVANNTLLSYSNASQYILSIQVSDGSLTAVANATVNILNAPPVVTGGSASIYGNAALFSQIGVTAVSSESNVTWSITAGNTGNAFAITSVGTIYVLTPSAVLEGVFSLTVQASDGTASGSATVTVTVSGYTLNTATRHTSPPVGNSDTSASNKKQILHWVSDDGSRWLTSEALTSQTYTVGQLYFLSGDPETGTMSLIQTISPMYTLASGVTFIRNVTVSGDGNTLVFSVPADPMVVGAFTRYPGAFEVWKNFGNYWYPQQILTSTEPGLLSAYYTSIGISHDGNEIGISSGADNGSISGTEFWRFVTDPFQDNYNLYAPIARTGEKMGGFVAGEKVIQFKNGTNRTFAQAGLAAGSFEVRDLAGSNYNLKYTHTPVEADTTYFRTPWVLNDAGSEGLIIANNGGTRVPRIEYAYVYSFGATSKSKIGTINIKNQYDSTSGDGVDITHTTPHVLHEAHGDYFIAAREGNVWRYGSDGTVKYRYRVANLTASGKNEWVGAYGITVGGIPKILMVYSQYDVLSANDNTLFYYEVVPNSVI